MKSDSAISREAERRAARRTRPEKVVDAFRDMLTRTTVDRISIADLSMVSEVGNGTIYHHFGSKAGIVKAAVAAAAHDYRIVVFLRRDVVAAHLEWVEEHREDARLLADHRAFPSRATRDLIDEAIEIAPALRITELWLDGRLPGRPTDYAARLSRS